MSDGADGIGSVATGGLIAREIERARGGHAAVGHSDDEPCANCGTVRRGPYCHECGQAGHVHRTLGALVHDISHGVFHFEGKIWKTLPMLAWRPGELTRRYVHGERAKFVSPMALFLFSVFLMFAVVANIGHHKAPKALSGNADAASAKLDSERANLETKIAAYSAVKASAPSDSKVQAKMDAKIADAQIGLKALAASEMVGVARPQAGAKPARDTDALKTNGFGTGLGWFDHLVAHTARNPELAAYKLKTYGYKYSWVLVPISLPFLWLLFCLRRDVGLYDHAIFAIYSLSFMSLGVVVLVVAGAIGTPSAIIALTAIFVPPLHMYRQLKGAYRLGRWGALWRTCALLLITSITLSLFLSFIIWMGSE